jgi:hypothetical protein
MWWHICVISTLGRSKQEVQDWPQLHGKTISKESREEKQGWPGCGGLKN